MSDDYLIMLWREKTWSERVQTILAFIIAGIVGLIMFMGVLFVVGASLEGVARYKSEHNRCLQKATNGYAIEQCR